MIGADLKAALGYRWPDSEVDVEPATDGGFIVSLKTVLFKCKFHLTARGAELYVHDRVFTDEVDQHLYQCYTNWSEGN